MNQWFQYPHKTFSKLFANIRIQLYVYSKTKNISSFKKVMLIKLSI